MSSLKSSWIIQEVNGCVWQYVLGLMLHSLFFSFFKCVNGINYHSEVASSTEDDIIIALLKHTINTSMLSRLALQTQCMRCLGNLFIHWASQGGRVRENRKHLGHRYLELAICWKLNDTLCNKLGVCVWYSVYSYFYSHYNMKYIIWIKKLLNNFCCNVAMYHSRINIPCMGVLYLGRNIGMAWQTFYLVN